MNDEKKCHTPFCRKGCSVVHHDLIKALCIERNRRESARHCSTCSHVLLRQCVQLYEQNGWDRNGIVPDDLLALRYPLVYLTCAFGKHRILETLVKLDFNLSILTKDGENGLHAVVGHFYRVGNMKQCGGFMSIEKRQDVFKNVVHILSAHDPRVFQVKETLRGYTPLHMVAECVVSPSRVMRGDGRCDPVKRSRYFQHCLEIMAKRLLELRDNSFLTHSEVMETIAAEDNKGNTILHILAESSSHYGWEAIQYVLKNFFDNEFFSKKNKQSESAFEILSNIDETVARKLFFPSEVQEDIKSTDKYNGLSPLNYVLSEGPADNSISGPTTSASFIVNQQKGEIAVKAVWSEAGHVSGPVVVNKSAPGTSPCKSLESVVLSLHTSARCTTTDSLQLVNTKAHSLTLHCDGSSNGPAPFHGDSLDTNSLVRTAEYKGGDLCNSMKALPTRLASFEQPDASDDEPYPVFLPNFPVSRSETQYTISSPLQQTTQQSVATVSTGSATPLSQSEPDNRVNALPLTPEAWLQDQQSEESMASSSAHLSSKSVIRSSQDSPDGLTANRTEKDIDLPSYPSSQENSAPSSSGDSAFFDFLLTQGTEFKPAMKRQIVELIKGEFGKTMESFNTAILQNEIEKRNLELEIRNAKFTLERKEEEKLRLFAEINQLQKNIGQATEKHKTLSQNCVKLKEESNAVKRKISSCEEVEKELSGNSAKMSKLLER